MSKSSDDKDAQARRSKDKQEAKARDQARGQKIAAGETLTPDEEQQAVEDAKIATSSNSPDGPPPTDGPPPPDASAPPLTADVASGPVAPPDTTDQQTTDAGQTDLASQPPLYGLVDKVIPTPAADYWPTPEALVLAIEQHAATMHGLAVDKEFYQKIAAYLRYHLRMDEVTPSSGPSSTPSTRENP